MELEFERETLRCYELAADLTLCQEETLESIVPDACPDILHIADVCGQAMLGSRQAKEGLAVVTGTVRAAVLYRPEGGGPGLSRMEVSLPFTCQAEAPGLTEAGAVLARVRLKTAEARALNPRKILLRADLAVELTAWQPVERRVCCGAAECCGESLCQRREQYSCCPVTAVGEKPFSVQTDLRLPAAQGESLQCLALQVQALCSEHKRIGSKLIFKGSLLLSCLLQNAAGGLTAQQEAVPFSQVMEAPEGEDGGCDPILIQVADVKTEPDPEGGTLRVTVELVAQGELRCRRTVTLLRDVYSTRCQMEVRTARQPLCLGNESFVRTVPVRELIDTERPIRSVVSAWVALGSVTQGEEKGRTALSAQVCVSVLCLDEEEQVQTLTKTIPVPCPMDGLPAGAALRCRVFCPGEVFAAPVAGGMELRFSLEFRCLAVQCGEVSFVESAVLGEARGQEGRRPSLVLRRAETGESLWDLAKQYGTTTERIAQANGLEGETPPAHRMLLIPGAR